MPVNLYSIGESSGSAGSVYVSGLLGVNASRSIPGGNLLNGVYSAGSSTLPFTGTADLSSVSAATINSLRQAFQIQKLYERDARGGTRYTEILRSHFGVVSPDSRLQRPEYLGGGQSPVLISQVPQTAPSGASSTPQGNLAAFGTASMNGHGFSKSFN